MKGIDEINKSAMIDKFDDLSQKLINLLQEFGYNYEANKLDDLCYDILYKIEHEE